MPLWLEQYGEAAKTAVGFFWKAGWAFVLGYAISAMIDAFVPKQKLTRHLGSPGAKSIALSTAVGAVSSSCSFAALAAARSLVKKGAHFVAGEEKEKAEREEHERKWGVQDFLSGRCVILLAAGLIVFAFTSRSMSL